MGTGAITQYVDVAQLVLYMFWIAFAGLIYYLVRENHREGYPMDVDGPRENVITGWPVPRAKTYRLADGSEVSVPRATDPQPEVSAEPSHGYIAAPLVPRGAPLTAGIGPGAWALRADHADLDPEGHPKIVPLRTLDGYGIAHQDRDPRGMPVLGADGQVAGIVMDAWIDRMEMMLRYLELEVAGTGGPRRVLLPMNFARVRRAAIEVQALYADQFAGVPPTRAADRITLLEEERITAYFGAGTLYADDERAAPFF
jgi:photosynthetic reaction center H subunit